MSVLYIALPVAVLLALAAVIGFIWTVRQGQYDDLETPAYRILEEEPPNRKPEDENRNNPGLSSSEAGMK